MKLILAATPSGGIGYKNKLPWSNIQGDLLRFKKLTTDKVVVMGRNTWESLPKKPLPNRLNFVVSSSELQLPVGAVQVNNLGQLGDYDQAWIIGGAALVNSSWHLIHEVHLSLTFAEYSCDTFVDLLKLHQEFTCIQAEEFADHVYQIWKRK
jgi:dihydrofolate reductase